MSVINLKPKDIKKPSINMAFQMALKDHTSLSRFPLLATWRR